MTFAQKIIRFNASLDFTGSLPPGISVMNPFRLNECATPASTAFYKKYYDDSKMRRIILGINPGRFGAGITGVPFTDPKRLAECCGINIPSCPSAHEPSSLFIYEVIKALGGPETFYRTWYINSICPLGFTKVGEKGRIKNYNYYDSAALEKAALPFILKTLPQQIGLGIKTSVCFCLGTGKNVAFLKKLNAAHGFFREIVPLAHPRYIIQYKHGQISEYVQKYVEKLSAWQ